MEEMNEKGLIKNLEVLDQEVLTLKDAYELLLKIYKKYVDWDEKNYSIIALWILGNFFHSVFETFPYLYLNAMKGSGKSRVEKLSAFLTGGDHTVNISEAALFREQLPLFLDEAENLRRKEKAILREVLNVAYKNGGVVIRMKKKDDLGNQEAVKLPVFRPIMIANIDGVDDVLEDRCISITLEKSFNPQITKRVELFRLDKHIKKFLEAKCRVVQCRVDILMMYECIAYYFSEYPLDIYTTLHSYIINTTLHQSTLNTEELTERVVDTIKKIDNAGLLGRDLEIWLPLFTIAAAISSDLLDNIINTAKELVIERHEVDILENKDMIFIGFMDYFMDGKTPNEWIKVNDIRSDFKNLNPDEERWCTSQWIGLALRRNKLISQKRRKSQGMEVIVDMVRLKEKVKKFDISEIKKMFVPKDKQILDFLNKEQ